MHFPDLVAHRGWARNYPENTLSAVDAAITAGARFVEIDVQLSSDAFPVLFHDRDLARMCGVKGAIHERTLSELRALASAETARFGSKFASEGIASLASFAQLVSRHPEVHAFVEIKRVAIERFGCERVLERVRTAMEPALGQYSLISFSLECLHAAKAQSAISASASSSSNHPISPVSLGAVFDKWSEREQREVTDLAPQYVFCDVDGLPRDGLLAHPGAKLVIYEVDDPKVASALRARGVHMVETFAIGEMFAAFRALEAKGE